ncbi:MAG TPA: site-2 protease family protein [Terriglobales bacterium]|nr:site-2 protease family protein [Terriglobales bacterium]
MFSLVLLLPIWMKQTPSTANDALRGVLLMVMILGSALLHELAHSVVAMRNGILVRSIVLLPLGGVSITDGAPFAPRKPDPAREIRIAMAGPLMSLGVAAAAAVLIEIAYPGVRLGAQPWIYPGGLLRSLVWTNICLGLINVLPAYPLDGGRILRAMLSRRMDYLPATRRAVTIGQGFAIAFFVLGMYSLWFTVVGLFIFVAAQLEERSIEFQAVLETVRMEDVMLTEFSTLSPADTLEHALSKAVHSLQDDFPVVRGNDMVGVISRQKILDALRFGGNAYVQSVMNSAYDIAERTETLASAFRKITSKNLSIIPVVDGEHLVGIVTLQNLMHSMGMLAESRKLQRQSDE